MAPGKRQKVEQDVKSEQQHQYHHSVPASPRRNMSDNPYPSTLCFASPPHALSAAHTPQPGPQPRLSGTQQNLWAVLAENPPLCPVEPHKNPVNSRNVDAIAHTMWDMFLAKADMMGSVSVKAAMYPPLKLRTLAKLDWLPSWWLLREMTLDAMMHSGWLVDDSERQDQWKESLEWCKKVELRLFGDGAATRDPGNEQVQSDLSEQMFRKAGS